MYYSTKFRLSDVGASIPVVHIRKFYKIYKTSFDSDCLLEWLKRLLKFSYV